MWACSSSAQETSGWMTLATVRHGPGKTQENFPPRGLPQLYLTPPENLTWVSLMQRPPIVLNKFGGLNFPITKPPNAFHF